MSLQEKRKPLEYAVPPPRHKKIQMATTTAAQVAMKGRALSTTFDWRDVLYLVYLPFQDYQNSEKYEHLSHNNC